MAAARRILCIGGGPAGLYFALLAKQADPARAVRVVERNRPYDTFGWGVVFSDQTLGNLEAADGETARQIVGAFNRWDDIDIHFRGRTIRSGGHGFCGIGRKRLLNILQARCEALGVELVFERPVDDDVAEAEAFGADLVIASDGEFGAPPAIAARVRGARDNLGLRVQGVLIGDRETIGLRELSDDIFWVRDWRRYGKTGGDGACPIHDKSLTATYFPGALR